MMYLCNDGIYLMPMKRVQVQFDEKDYQTIRKIGFVENKAISEIIREATKNYINLKKDINEKFQHTFADSKEVEQAINNSINDFEEIYEKLAQ
ncbi:MAG: hypothetical protein U0354_02725 [Candidatus Sericytochromatia bacterium]